MKTTVQENLTLIVQLVFQSINAEFARYLEISPQQLNNYISGKHGIGNTMRNRLRKVGINPDWVENSIGSIFTDTPEGKKLKGKIEDIEKYKILENQDLQINDNTIAVNISKITEASIKVQFKFSSFNIRKNDIHHKDLSDTLSASNIITQNPESAFLMTVTGHGMESSGIMKNDSLIVNTSIKPQKNNTVVVVFMDGIYVIKKWVKKGDGVYLESAHNLKPIEYFESDDFYIFGVVESIFRKLV